MEKTATLKQKFATWWRGYEVGETEEPAEVVAVPYTEAPRRVTQDISACATVLQELWGHGCVTPGPPEFIQEITAHLGLNSEMSMLDLGAGLGGPARAISEEYGIWVTAYEANEVWATAGMEQSIMAGLGKKVPIAPYDPEEIELPEQKFDCVVSKEVLHLSTQKARILREVEGALKPRGQFLIVDYVKNDEGDGAKIAAWNDADEVPSNFWTADAFVSGFDTAELELSVTEDLTDRYVQMIMAGFRKLTRNMDGLIEAEEDTDKQLALRRALAYETRRWAVRAEAMQSGAVSVKRFSGMSRLEPEIR